MKITLGEWKTRDGRKAIVAAENPRASTCFRFIGWIGEESCSWDSDGSWVALDAEHDNDLIAPWTEPVRWDWSTTPPWINWIAMDRDGDWVMFIEEPETIDDMWASCKAESGIYIPRYYAPKWNGSWHLSKTQRPKEVAR